MAVNMNAYGESPYASLFPATPTEPHQATTSTEETHATQEAAMRRALAEQIVRIGTIVLKVLAVLVAIGLVVAGVAMSILTANPLYAVGSLVAIVPIVSCLMNSAIQRRL